MSSEVVLLLICSFFWVYYITFVLRIRHGLSLLSTGRGPDLPLNVSVIVAARNEEGTISQALHALLDQSYPAENTEIIVVDDRSSDRTGEIAQTLAETERRVKLITVQIGDQRTSQGKPEAIAEGVKHSGGAVILTTDADCIVPKNWIASMVSNFDEGTALVAGPVSEIGAKNLLGRLSAVEFLGLIASSAGLIGLKSPIFCNGANIAFRKSAFVDAGGFGDSWTSCDDEVLLQRIHSRGLGAIKYSINIGSVVTTEPVASLFAFFHQRLRWAAKRGHYEHTGILVRLILLYMSFLSLFVLGLSTFYFSASIVSLVVFLLGKAAVDFAALTKAGFLFHQSFSLREFMIAELFHVPYIVFIALLGQLVSPQWKSRNL